MKRRRYVGSAFLSFVRKVMTDHQHEHACDHTWCTTAARHHKAWRRALDKALSPTGRPARSRYRKTERGGP